MHVCTVVGMSKWCTIRFDLMQCSGTWLVSLFLLVSFSFSFSFEVFKEGPQNVRLLFSFARRGLGNTCTDGDHYEVIVDKNVNNAIVCQRCYFIKHSMAQRGTPHCNCLLLFNETNERVYWACTPERANVTFEWAFTCGNLTDPEPDNIPVPAPTPAPAPAPTPIILSALSSLFFRRSTDSMVVLVRLRVEIGKTENNRVG